VGEAGKGLGQNVVMVYVFQTRFPGDIQPQAVKQDDILILHVGVWGTDAEGVDDAVGLNDLQQELLFGFRYGFPSAAQVKAARRSSFCWRAGDGRRRTRGCGRSGRWPTRVAKPAPPGAKSFAHTFGDRDGAREQGLLVVAEDLFGGKAVSGASELN